MFLPHSLFFSQPFRSMTSTHYHDWIMKFSYVTQNGERKKTEIRYKRTKILIKSSITLKTWIWFNHKATASSSFIPHKSHSMTDQKAIKNRSHFKNFVKFSPKWMIVCLWCNLHSHAIKLPNQFLLFFSWYGMWNQINEIIN